MSHDKSRSHTTVSGVDWSDPYLKLLLEKTADWRLENRSNLPPHEVQLLINSGLMTGKTAQKPALVVKRSDDSLVLLTHYPIQQGARVGVDSLRSGGASVLWGKVIDGREGRRAEDQEHGLYLSWLRLD